ncbi:hypothetical protein GT022_20300 [Agaribacter marinus]|uniref:Uncharacterized protein n=1 Tax=Virgibacillus salarius TaxID=447199 RepID=A0A941DZT3_9BACI|nr:hypothetical protein [Virgibacillus salarius]MBR7798341.1 hypothetical protein [Virgibacillus salarius]NAZ11050.1 hypothetical protein [Agaribacter marinus]WBX80611.1 hypothetical protein PD280_01730 [Virgibacillus salarius]
MDNDKNFDEPKEQKSKINFDFGKSLNETKGILKDAIIRPHSVVKSNHIIGIETSILILLILSIIIGLCNFLFFKFGFDGLLSMFTEIGIMFLITGTLSWIITFAAGYISLYMLLKFLGNAKFSHRELLTKYAVVNIPFAAIFCLVICFFGFLMIDLFVITYVFALMLYGVIHIYLFLVHINKPKFDLYWTMAGYLLVLTVLTYMLNGIDFSSF